MTLKKTKNQINVQDKLKKKVLKKETGACIDLSNICIIQTIDDILDNV